MLGTGTALNPYLIETPQDISLIRNNLGADYKLVNNIDMTGITHVPIGSTSAPFTGNLDGNGHVIRNLSLVGNNTNYQYIGLFSVAVGGSFKNLGVEDSSLHSPLSGTNPLSFSAILIGRAGVTGNKIKKTVVEKCYVKNSSITGKVGQRLGSIVGLLDSGNVLNCYAENITVEATGYSSLLVGWVDSTSTLTNTWNNGTLTSTGSYYGGAGAIITKSDAVNTYFDSTQAYDIAKQTNLAGTPLTPAQMKQQSSYVGFDFNTVWGMAEYPYLKVFGEILPPALSGEESVTSFMRPIESKATSRFIPAPKRSTQSVTSYMNEIESNVTVSSKQSRTVNVSSYTDKIESSLETKRIAIVRTIRTVTSFIQPITAESNSIGKRKMTNYVSSNMRSLQGYSVSSIHRPYKHVLAYTEVIVDGSGASWKVNESSVEHRPLLESNLYVVEHNSKTLKQDNLSYTEVIE